MSRTIKLAAIAAGVLIAATTTLASAGPAQAVGPSSCYKSVGNTFGAWHAAYGQCSGGYGHVQVVGTFRNLSGHYYTVSGNWVGIGSTSKAYAAGWLDTAVSAKLNIRVF